MNVLTIFREGLAIYYGIPVIRDAICSNALVIRDARQDIGEDRFIVIRTTGRAILYVVYTYRRNRRRVISARKATWSEREEHQHSI